MGVLLLVTGCGMAKLSPAGAMVAASGSSPTDEGFDASTCTSLGYVVGRGDATVGTPEERVEYAINDLRNKAAKMDANFVQHGSPELVGSTVATVSGTAYHCERAANVPRTTATPAQPSPSAELTAPDGLAAFKFGASQEEAEATCARAKGTWTPSSDQFLCSAMPWSVGIRGNAQLQFCDDALCHVELVTPDDATGQRPVREVLKLRELLVDKYSAPSAQRQSVPAECHERIAPCLVAGTASLDYVWKFSAGTSIRLLAEKTEAGARTRLIYDQAADAKSAL